MLSNPQTEGVGLTAALKRSVKDHWGIFLGEGIVLVVLGLLAMATPLFAGIATTVFLGWLLLVAGGVGLAATLRAKHTPGFLWSLLSASVALFVGLVLVVNPLQGLVTLTYVITGYFIADGVFVCAYALSHRQELSGRWEWMLVNGVVDLVLAALIISGMPGSLVWVLGLLVGVDLLFGGVALIGMALDARSKALPSVQLPS